MSERLAVSAALSVLMMVCFVLVASPSAQATAGQPAATGPMQDTQIARPAAAAH